MRHLFTCCLLAILVGCTSSSPTHWEDSGGWLFDDHQYGIAQSVAGNAHRFVLQRVAEADAVHVIRWEGLDQVQVTLAADEFMCMGPARSADGTEYLAVAREDKSHTHPVTRAWKFEKALGKLVLSAATELRLECDVEECNDDEDE